MRKRWHIVQALTWDGTPQGAADTLSTDHYVDQIVGAVFVVQMRIAAHAFIDPLHRGDIMFRLVDRDAESGKYCSNHAFLYIQFPRERVLF